MTNQNKGVIQPQLNPSDFIAGQETAIIYDPINLQGDWTNYLPKKETQYINTFDTSACVTFSALNCLETQLNFLLPTLSKDAQKKLKDWGYIEDGKLNFSDRFTAKMAGTTTQGNSLQKVWDSIHNDGLVPEAMWPSAGNKNWAEYYKEIPQQIKDFGKNILILFDFKYEWVVTGNCGTPNLEYLKYHLKQSPLQPAHPLCGRDDLGNMKLCPGGVCMTQHATTIYTINDLIRDFDHYYPYLNNYPLGYTFPWIMKGVVIVKKPEPTQPTFDHVFNVDLKYGQKGAEVIWLQKALNVLGYKIPISPDNGYFEQTRTAVLDFQKKNNVDNILTLIALNGKVVGPKTRNKINELLK